MILVDTNVLIDVLADDPDWAEWSEAQLIAAIKQEELAINPIIYAELAVAYRTAAGLEKALKHWPLTRLELPYDAGFLAAHAFRVYRQRGGTKHRPLPDFYIGAHAQTSGLRLLTRDGSRYASYFPRVPLITP
ncbi:type II toxin-antitoxin system VapC family toxin [Actomonas aquatica]|uniref:Ribonuclease VapC n=1 Tax=Actomonas aquatica TaxID=2866162 RepID=A0ABZ1CET1_9BACT|nr:type II toxin-antitoxin system VapC family toxin [Opitutus sp. WL0086]WRQ89738.1 type II toxin-antitoxin system VapC family toxin [Opitutus sp. WL0086]